MKLSEKSVDLLVLAIDDLNQMDSNMADARLGCLDERELIVAIAILNTIAVSCAAFLEQKRRERT